MRNFVTEFRSRTNRQAGFCRTLAVALTAALALGAALAHAEQLSSDAKESIPHDVQQIIVVDYRAMQNSAAAMSLRDHVMPPELKKLQDALTKSGMKVDEDTDALAFASFRMPNPDGKGGPEIDQTIGIAQGQFQTRDILANFAKNKIKPLVIRNNSIYPMGAAGLSVVFLNQTTMVFGSKQAVTAAVDSRDGIAPNFMTDSELVSNMNAVDGHAIWSLLDAKGTQTMMNGMLAGASQLGDYDSVKNQMKGSRYTMDFANGVKFDMAVTTSDTLTAATIATVLKGLQLLKEQSGSPMEKGAMDQTTIDSSAGMLTVSYASSDSQFASLLTSPLFQTVVK